MACIPAGVHLHLHIDLIQKRGSSFTQKEVFSVRSVQQLWWQSTNTSAVLRSDRVM